MELFNYRKSYTKNKLSMNDIGDNPIDFFVKWFKEAENSDQLIEPNAMTISTVDENSSPSSRVVLLKQIKERSLIFFTNYNSNKGKSLDKNENISFIQNLNSIKNKVDIKILKTNSKFSYWPYFAPESCISFRKDFYKRYKEKADFLSKSFKIGLLPKMNP